MERARASWLALSLLAGGVAHASELALEGPAVAVRAERDGEPASPAVVERPDGGFTVLWTETGLADPPFNPIRARRFDAVGAVVGGELRIDGDDPLGSPPVSGPNADAAPDGGFVVVWATRPREPDDASAVIAARRVSAGGAPVAPASIVALTDHPYPPDVAVSARGFVVTWIDDDWNVRFARFDLEGRPVGVEHVLPRGAYAAPSTVVADAAGAFAVLWERWGCGDGTCYGEPLLLRGFDPDGAPAGPVQPLAWEDAAVDLLASADAGPGGLFVVAWVRAFGELRSPVQIFDELGPVGPPFERPHRAGTEASVAVGEGGDFLLAWTGRDDDGPVLEARAYDRFGSPLGATVTTGRAAPSEPPLRSFAAAALPAGRFAVAWSPPVDAHGRDLVARTLRLVEPFFRDGFESGDARGWARVVPGG